MNMDRVCTCIGIVVLWGNAMCMAGAQETQAAVVAAKQDATEASTGNDKAASRALQTRNPRYELCRGDIFDLIFPLTPDFNQTITVQPDGYITLTGLGDIYVAGKTLPEMRELLHTAYSKTLHDPIIQIILKDFQKPYFIVGGQISHPGKFEMRDETTATQAIAIAGGFTESSKHSQVLLFRRVSNDWVEVKKLDVKSMFQSENLAEDLHLRSGDMLFVPQNRISKLRKYIPFPSLGMFLDPTKF